jgi:hypothetical protein
MHDIVNKRVRAIAEDYGLSVVAAGAGRLAHSIIIPGIMVRKVEL